MYAKSDVVVSCIVDVKSPTDFTLMETSLLVGLEDIVNGCGSYSLPFRNSLTIKN